MINRLSIAALLIGLASPAFAFCPTGSHADLREQMDGAVNHALCLADELGDKVAQQARDAELQAQINAQRLALDIQLRMQQAASAFPKF